MSKDSNKETQSPWQNGSEKVINCLKEMSKQILDRSGAPEKNWMFVVKYASQIMNQ